MCQVNNSMGLIYRATFPSGKCYIGRTTRTLEERKKEHRHDAKIGVSRVLPQKINKYGWDTVVWEVMEYAPNDLLVYLEEKYIEFCDCVVPNGYNMTDRGDGGGRWSEERKKQKSEAMLGEKNPFYNCTHTEEALAKMRKPRNIQLSDKQRKAISERTSGENNPMYGVKHTEEAKLLMSIAATGRKRPPEVVELTAKANRGKKRSPETCEKIRKALKGQKFTPERRANISKARKAGAAKRRAAREADKNERGIARWI